MRDKSDDEIVRLWRTGGKILIAGCLTVIVMFSFVLVFRFDDLSLLNFLAALILLPLGVIGLIAGVAYYLKPDHPDHWLVKLFTEREDAFRKGGWKSFSLFPMAFFALAVWGSMVAAMAFTDGFDLMVLILICGFSAMNSYIFYGAFKRRGWLFRRLENFSADEFIALMEKSNVRLTQIQTDAAFFNAKACVTFRINDSDFKLTIIAAQPWPIMGIWKADRENKARTDEITRCIDSNLGMMALIKRTSG